MIVAFKKKVYCGGCGKYKAKLSNYEKKFIGREDYVRVCGGCASFGANSLLGTDIRRVKNICKRT